MCMEVSKWASHGLGQLPSSLAAPPGETDLSSVLDLTVSIQKWKRMRFRSLGVGRRVQ